MRYGGRQLIFKTPEELEARVEEYFDACDNKCIVIDSSRGPINRQRPYTISGLCYHLRISRVTWSEYSNRPEYRDVCELAKLRVENYTEEAALVGAVHPIFSIFSLKNNFRESWQEKIDLGLPRPQEPLTVNDIQNLLQQRRLSLVPGRDSEE